MKDSQIKQLTTYFQEDFLNLIEKERFYIPESARAYFVACAPELIRKKIIFVPTSGSLLEDYFYEAKSFFNGHIFMFPDFEVLPHEKAKIESALQSKRIEFLNSIKQETEPFLAFVHPFAFLRKFPPLAEYQPTKVVLRVGEIHPFEDLIDELERMGYERVDVCEHEGTFALRGGLLDIFPAESESPYRIEFFGDEITDIREFDIVSQTSINKIGSIEIGWRSDTPRINTENLNDEIANQILKLKSDGYSLSGYWPLIFERLESLKDYLLNEEYLFVFENLEKLEHEIINYYQQLKDPVESGFAVTSDSERYFVSAEEIIEFLYSTNHIEIGVLKGSSEEIVFEEIEKRALRDRMLFYEYLKGLEEIVVIKGADLNQDRVENSVRKSVEKLNIRYSIIPGYLRSGFILRSKAVGFVPAFFFTGGQVMMKSRKQIRVKGEKFFDLKPSDLVVHPRYGIGRYEGIEKQVIDEFLREYVVIEYADGRIKIPLEQADVITKYYGEEEKVQLDRIGSNEWQKAKQKAQRSARKLAFDLLKVYAKRSLIRRKPYDITNPWIYEFESLFPYEETLDQAAAINDIYMDMASEYPMERLIIGDVGYGKTEVAMRASFVAVVNGKQVIVMAPTTVLSEQHFSNWKDRFQHFPVTIGYLSRFQSPAQRKRTIEEFNLGKIDILIGTHAVLSKEIDLNNVSLVIIDEEHRFGVNQKEIFKARKPEIDILMLSATPIPRSLQIALSGLRPISLIETPPPGRLPVVTHVGEFDEILVLNALKREIERNGQALYVHNDISKLPQLTQYFSSKLENARVAFAHGQMPEKQLEKTMLEFWEGKYDILVCTTIIESGLDMPNVNTLVVDGAEKLGLAQAYQLRGRVGRSYRQAYAYFLTRKSFLTEREEKRLRALLEMSGWGSGYRLALRDLEIRGAGNLLGAEQHGHMVRVGIGYFLELLKQEVEMLKTGKKETKPKELSIDLPIDIHIPDDYIDSLRVKYEIYHRAAQLKTKEQMEELKNEIRDRFGELPKSVKNLIKYGLVRNLAKEAGINFIKYGDGILTFRGKIPASVLIREIEELKDARGTLNQVSKEITRKEILSFLINVFAGIISKIKLEGSN
ncbi:MAG: transcription-repair coupling factor [Actinobacteria bacterium]|nr:transcription-repair coupling factor [Actinomycetota bacterium]